MVPEPVGGAGREAGVGERLRLRLLPSVGKQICSNTLSRLELAADLAGLYAGTQPKADPSAGAAAVAPSAPWQLGNPHAVIAQG
jgi:hypothetical protein